jgi:hypothetical protein
MTVLGYNGRNRIAAPTHGHEWRAGAPFSANRNRLHHPSGAGTWHTIYTHKGHTHKGHTHKGHTLKGTRQVVMGRDSNFIASAREHSTSSEAPITVPPRHSHAEDYQTPHESHRTDG